MLMGSNRELCAFEKAAFQDVKRWRKSNIVSLPMLRLMPRKRRSRKPGIQLLMHVRFLRLSPCWEGHMAEDGFDIFFNFAC